MQTENKQKETVNTPKPVLFWDFHGTLTLPDITWFDAATEAAAQAVPQRVLDPDCLQKNLSGNCLPWFTVPERDTRHLLPNDGWWAHSQQNFIEMYQRCGFTKEEAEAAAPGIRQRVLQTQRYQLYPDAVSTLEALRARGYHSLILSNNFPELPELVKALGLGGLFETVLTSGRIGYDKPRPEIFEAARKTAGWPDSCWMIGDNPVDDIEGGHGAGFTTVAVHGIQAPAADHSVMDLAEILPLLP